MKPIPYPKFTSDYLFPVGTEILTGLGKRIDKIYEDFFYVRGSYPSNHLAKTTFDQVARLEAEVRKTEIIMSRLAKIASWRNVGWMWHGDFWDYVEKEKEVQKHEQTRGEVQPTGSEPVHEGEASVRYF